MILSNTTLPYLHWELLKNFKQFERTMDANHYMNEVIKTIEQGLIFTDTDKINNEWLLSLSKEINDLILHNFDSMISLLYRLDIDEFKVRKLLKDYPDKDAGRTIAELIIKRQLQKIKTRATFGRDASSIDENEKW